MSRIHPKFVREDLRMSEFRFAPVPKYPSKEHCLEVAKRIIDFGTRKGDKVGTSVRVQGGTEGGLRWARNQVSSGTESTDRQIIITSVSNGQTGVATTNEATDEALKATVLDAESLSGHTKSWRKDDDENLGLLGPQEYDKPDIFHQSSLDFNTRARSTSGQELVKTANDAAFMSYGYMASGVGATGIANTNNLVAYQAKTSAEFSCTVRSKNEGSGWAGLSHDNFSKIDVKAIMARAIDKCKNSQNPTRMEPGRHVAILEPQALADLFTNVFLPPIFNRPAAERAFGPYAAPGGKTKIGQQMLDRRFTVYSDPMDADAGFRPFTNSGSPIHKHTWFEKGVLVDLPYPRDYAVKNKLNNGYALPMGGGYRMVWDGPTKTIEEMIAETRRGFLITRFHGSFPVEFKSLQCNGNTRDGFWYIENGQIKHPVKNFRFNESPFFILNEVDAVGVSQRIYNPLVAAVVPPVKVRNFNFISLTDAV
jgi:predicted Zn-dependent protease